MRCRFVLQLAVFGIAVGLPLFACSGGIDTCAELGEGWEACPAPNEKVCTRTGKASDCLRITGGTASPSDAGAKTDGAACSFSGQVRCNGTCVDLDSDDRNCGTCGKVCPSGDFCSGGTCR